MNAVRLHTKGAVLSELLAAHAAKITADRVSLADIQEALGHKSICVWLLVLALPMVLPIPAPGISVVFGLPLMLVSAQLMLGYRHAWLPALFTRRSLSRSDYAAIVARMQPAIRWMERLIRPRVPWFANHWIRVPAGLICLILAAIITLPVPLGHVVPGAAICLLALGLMEGDGMVVGLGILTSALGLALVSLASAGLVDLTRDWFLG
ncbi:MAG TPA: exopolysaccharide biosynthesis protein [Bradyrhizobium sp.]|nr:exopolysaccharide biosynthesis protein [Bradyrhizobium sp.]